LGINSKTVKDVFRSNSDKTPVVYLFLIGYANKILKDGVMYGDNMLLCKFGCTEDLVKRISQHEVRYKKDYGIDISIELLTYTIVDPKFLYEAEGGIRDYFKGERYDNKSELILINKNNIDKVKNFYKAIHSLYIGGYRQIEEKVKQLEGEKYKLERELEEEKYKLERELEKEKNKNLLLEKDREIEREKYERTIDNDRHQIEILKLKLQIASGNKL
jgi:hypothetical protein